MTDRNPGAAWARAGDAEGVIRLQAEHHFSVDDRVETVEEFCLALIHQRAYGEALELAPGGRVLDLGCNNGYGTVSLAEAGLNVIGVDVSTRLLEQARARSPLHRTRFLEVDGLRLPFADASFDLVTSFQVIEHIADTAPYLGEITRVLKPGGVAMFSTPNAALRLDPGMTPWNIFHVREFRATELEEVLTPWFGAVQVQGLYGVDELYTVERQRVETERARARREQQRWLPRPWQLRTFVIDAIKKSLPAPLTERLRSFVREREVRDIAADSRPRPAQPGALPKFTSQDLFYRSDRTDDALDLLAVCRV
jgi:ubiquinone/menaquinone biosynthesis C-methylase UbiE